MGWIEIQFDSWFECERVTFENSCRKKSDLKQMRLNVIWMNLSSNSIKRKYFSFYLTKLLIYVLKYRNNSTFIKTNKNLRGSSFETNCLRGKINNFERTKNWIFHFTLRVAWTVGKFFYTNFVFSHMFLVGEICEFVLVFNLQLKVAYLVPHADGKS